ncbi:unnamed protein product [Echinostoma caproni]|uniref:Otopetrin n=1 Tax=Echinostoma caproni TaxID=27848 RepID=A0A183A7X1_9TREM|nr:unnamed protein product [Echinostoma caproni]
MRKLNTVLSRKGVSLARMPENSPNEDGLTTVESEHVTVKRTRIRARPEHILTSPIASLTDWRKRRKAKRQIMYRHLIRLRFRWSLLLAYELSGSVRVAALRKQQLPADIELRCPPYNSYETGNASSTLTVLTLNALPYEYRTSAMSSLLLLFAVLEGMCGFVLPICSAFSKPTGSLKRYYYEDFLLIQYCLSILALCYLQALICYYDQKENLRQKRHLKFLQKLNEEEHQDYSMQMTVRDEPDSYEYSSPMSQRYAFTENVAPNTNPPGDHSMDGNLPDPCKPLEQSSVTVESLPALSEFQIPRGNNQSQKVKFSLCTVNHDSSSNPVDTVHVDCDELEPGVESCNAVHTNSVPVTVVATVTTPTTMVTSSINPVVIPTPLDLSPLPITDCPLTPDSIQLASPSESSTVNRVRRYGTVRRNTMVPFKFLFGDDPENPIARGKYLSRDSEGVNLYLRLGAVGFGFGVMIFDGFKIAEPWEADITGAGQCHSSLWIPIHVLHFVYVFWQTYFLFKHHQIVFNVQKFALRFLLCHLAVANLCQWLKTIVDEISDEPPHEAETVANESHSLWAAFGHNLVKRSSQFNLSLADVHSTYPVEVINFTSAYTTEAETHHLGSCRSTAKYLAPFLFPCAIEYSLIAGAIFYKMFQKIGHMQEESERLARMRKANNLTRRFAECHRSHKGLFIGLLLFMATLVTMCLFFIFFTKENKKHTAITLYQCTELVLLALSLLTCIATMLRFRVLKFSELSEEGAFDDNLLLVGLIGMIFYDLFLLVPALEAFPSGITVARLFAAKALLEIVQSMLQVFFILEASRRCAGSLAHVRNKPGRTLITFLLILNLAMWFVNTFEVKRADNQSIHIDYYTGMAWKIITHIALPMIVFFRFHSTVCLSDIWANAYRFRAD